MAMGIGGRGALSEVIWVEKLLTNWMNSRGRLVGSCGGGGKEGGGRGGAMDGGPGVAPAGKGGRGGTGRATKD